MKHLIRLYIGGRSQDGGLMEAPLVYSYIYGLPRQGEAQAQSSQQPQPDSWESG